MPQSQLCLQPTMSLCAFWKSLGIKLGLPWFLLWHAITASTVLIQWIP